MFEQGQTHDIGQFFDLHGDGWLRQEQFFSGTGKAAMPVDGFKHLQLAQGSMTNRVIRYGRGWHVTVIIRSGHKGFLTTFPSVNNKDVHWTALVVN